MHGFLNHKSWAVTQKLSIRLCTVGHERVKGHYSKNITIVRVKMIKYISLLFAGYFLFNFLRTVVSGMPHTVYVLSQEKQSKDYSPSNFCMSLISFQAPRTSGFAARLLCRIRSVYVFCTNKARLEMANGV